VTVDRRAAWPLGLCAIGLFCCAWPAAAHHSVSAWFLPDERQEIEGVVTEVRWENPHVRFFMRAPNADGEDVIWEIETLSSAGIRRWGITPDLLSVGDHVRISGSPSRRGLANIFVRNMLLPSGQELAFGVEPIYSDDALRGGELLEAEEGVAADAAQGIFKVWSSGSNSGWPFPEDVDSKFDFSAYPLTEAAQAALDAFDYLDHDPTRNCVAKGMTVIMEEPYPIQLIDEGDTIRFLLEEYDTVRVIHMRNVPPADSVEPSPLGFSVGRMEDRDLVVTTTKINSGTFDSVGIPLSLEAVVTERFSPSANGADLVYTLVVDDPVNFTEPVETGKRYIYLPDATVQPFNCTE
jgi:Family of unknown function (DUF6152)